MKTFRSLSAKKKREMRDRFADKISAIKNPSRTQQRVAIRLFEWSATQNKLARA